MSCGHRNEMNGECPVCSADSLREEMSNLMSIIEDLTKEVEKLKARVDILDCPIMSHPKV